MKKAICLLLVLAYVIGAAACSEAPKESSENSTITEAQSAAEETEEDTTLHDNLPSDLTYDGRTLRLLSSLPYYGKTDTDHRNLTVEKETGDVLNDAIYKCAETMCSRFDITITEDEMPYQDCLADYTKLVKAGDDAYDIVSLTDRDVISVASQGMIIPMDDVEYVDLSQPYWNNTLNETASIGGKHYVCYGDFNLSSYDFTHILLFNTQVINDFSLENPYDIVESGDWTFDKFEEMALTVTADLDGDGKMGDDDRYGWLCAPKQASPLIWIAGGTLSVEKDEEDIPQFTMDGDKILTLLQKAYDMTWGSDYWYQNTINDVDVTDPPIFSSGRALFSSTACSSLFGSYYREIEFDYGIIPYPKYDEAQEKYYTRVEGGTPRFVPSTTETPDFSGAMLEAFACESANTVIPAYYEISLKVKYARDEQSIRMLEMMMENRVYDLGDTLFNEKIRDGFVLSVFSKKKAITASDVEKNRKTVERTISKTVEALEEEYN